MASEFRDSLRDSTQVRFGGLDHNLGAGDGALWDMQNLTGDYFPLLATRERRRISGTVENPQGIFAWESLAWAGNGGFYFNGALKGSVAAGAKTFAAMGAYIIILPDKAYYNILENEFGSLESSVTTTATFADGTYAGEAAEGNTILADANFDWAAHFRVGDAVSISGAADPENNKTIIIREIAGNELRFYENSFSTTTLAASITVERTMPDLVFLCENENRLWGSDGKRIYASKLGDPFNWNVFDGLDTDSWSWPADEAGIIGGITACVSYQGYAVFFQEDHVYKVYGSRPKNFQTMGGSDLGVKTGADRSLAIANETLFYLSPAGFVAYGGGQARPIGQAFGRDRQMTAVGGSDGLKYYASMQGTDGTWRLGVYDATRGTWHLEDDTHALGFARYGSNLWALNAAGRIHTCGDVIGAPETEEDAFPWYAEFGDIVDDSPEKKGLELLQIRLELEAGANCSAWLRYDSTGDWVQAGDVMAQATKRSYILPIVPRRADHYRLKLTGTGGCRVYSITRRFYPGSKLKSLPGIN